MATRGSTGGGLSVFEGGKGARHFSGKDPTLPITGYRFFYPSFVVPKSKPASYRWVLSASYNRYGPSVNDKIFDYSTKLINVKESLYPMLRTRFMSRIDLKLAFKQQLFRLVSQLYLLATVVDNLVFMDTTMSMGLRNTCKHFAKDFMKAFIRGLWHHHPKLFSDVLGATRGQLPS